MTKKKLSRRDFVDSSLAGIGLLSIPFNSTAQINPPLKVVCIGGHPDDPETGCGGTLAKFAKAGHSVTIIYLTSGDAGIRGKTRQEAAAIRIDEAEKACAILGAKAVFAGQPDGDSVVNDEWTVKLRKLLELEKPDLAFTHWPIDSHKDHMVTSVLTQRALIEMEAKFPLYFYEVYTGRQTRHFHPTDYVDITDTQELKREAVFCHKSQGFVSLDYYHEIQGMMEDFRGVSVGVKAAEAFVKLEWGQMAII